MVETQQELRSALGDARAVAVEALAIGRDELAAAPHLKLVQKYGAGLAALSLASTPLSPAIMSMSGPDPCPSPAGIDLHDAERLPVLVVHGALDDREAAAAAGLRPHFDEVIRRAEHRFIVLDDSAKPTVLQAPDESLLFAAYQEVAG